MSSSIAQSINKDHHCPNWNQDFNKKIPIFFNNRVGCQIKKHKTSCQIVVAEAISEMDERLTGEIIATCDSIGYADKDKYYKDPGCLECVKDLVLYLRRDDDDHSIRRLLGRTHVVQRDLLPLLKHYSEDLELYDVNLRLLVNLTHPALLLYNEEVPKNKKYLSYFLEIDQNLRTYKAAFVDKLVWDRLSDRLKHLLNLEWDKRMEDDKLALERILVLIRNILMVASDPSEEKRTDDENSLHDRVLMVMHLSGIEDLLLFVASSDTTKEYCLHVIEIISLMLREQTGEQVARTKLIRNEEDKLKDERELMRIRQKEAVVKNIQDKKLTSRHSRFGGTFTVLDVKAPSGRDLLCHKPINSTADLSLDATKKTKRTANNRMTMNEDDPTRRSTIPVRLILKEFCSEFLDKAYNSIMNVVKDNINRGRMQDHDETYYLWAMKFFMEFNRYHKFRVSYVSETMSTNAFHYVQTLLDNYHGMMVTDKEKIPYWSKRAHMALKAYEELLYTLLWMDKYGSEAVKGSSRVIKTNVFYLPEYRELCFSLLNTYDPVKLSKLYLKDLVETNHLFLKMLEEFAKSSKRILVKTKGKKRKKGKKSKKAKKPRREVTKDPEELEEIWMVDAEEISTALQVGDGDETEDGGNLNVIPFDAASDIPIDDQKVTAVERIAVFLHTKKYKEAVILLRASREVWPESKEEFGESGIQASDEFSVLKSIFLEKASLPAVSTAFRELEEAQIAEEEEENNEEEDEIEEEEEEVRMVSKEQEFDFFGFVLKYSAPKIVGNYAKLFKDWETLKPFTLHCVMKMFHRFVFQMEYPALICQASVFRTFQKILQVADHQSELKEIAKFFYHLWPKFVKLCENNKTMFVEILFWKTAKEAQEIQDGYGSYSNKPSENKPSKFIWTDHEEEELSLLAEQYSASPDEVKKSTKLIAWIRERWTGRPKSKKNMTNKLVEKGLMVKPLRKKADKKGKSQMDSDKDGQEGAANKTDDSDSDDQDEAINSSLVNKRVDSDSDEEHQSGALNSSMTNKIGKSRINSDSDEEDQVEAVNSSLANKKDDSDSEEVDQDEALSSSLAKKKGKYRIDSEEEDQGNALNSSLANKKDDSDSDKVNQDEALNSSITKKKGKYRIDSDSEEEDQSGPLNSPLANKKVDSDEEDNKKGKYRIDSDSEEENQSETLNSSLVKKKGKYRIDSDSEEDEDQGETLINSSLASKKVDSDSDEVYQDGSSGALNSSITKTKGKYRIDSDSDEEDQNVALNSSLVNKKVDSDEEDQSVALNSSLVNKKGKSQFDSDSE